MHLYGKKHLKIIISKTEDALWLNLCKYHRGQKVYQSCYNGRTLTFDLFTARSSLLPYAFVWEKCSEFQRLSGANVDQISFGASLGQGKWLPSIDQDGHPAIYGKTFKNLLLQNRGYLLAESLYKLSWMGGLPK